MFKWEAQTGYYSYKWKKAQFSRANPAKTFAVGKSVPVWRTDAGTPPPLVGCALRTMPGRLCRGARLVAGQGQAPDGAGVAGQGRLGAGA